MHVVRCGLPGLERCAWTTPISDRWGYDRGTPVDRYYIEQFLAEHRGDIRGHVLEGQNAQYTDRFGSAVERRDILDIDADNTQATLIADLSAGDGIPAGRFDCFILTQTLQFIYDLPAALAQGRRLLRPGGVLLATMPCLSKIDPALETVDFWRFTPASITRLFAQVFGSEQATVRAYGNVLAGIAFLTGMAAEELSAAELGAYDRFFPVLVGVRATKT